MTFDFYVKRNSKYRELIVKIENVNASSGLLNKEESIDLAKELIYAAEQLLPMGTDNIKQQLCKVVEDL